MSHASYIEKYVYGLLPDNLEGLSILDAGCGIGSLVYKMRFKKDGQPIITGVDIYEPFIDLLEEIGPYTEVFHDDLSEFVEQISKFKESWDIVLYVDVAEHIEKEASKTIITKLEEACNQLMIVSTPRYLVKNINNYPENEFNAHISSDYGKFLQEKGFKKIRYSRGLEISFLVKGLFCLLTGRPVDVLSDVYYKKYPIS